MQRIVLATDLSDVLDDMVSVVASFAGPLGASVYIVYCHLPHEQYVQEDDNAEHLRERRRTADRVRDQLRDQGVMVPHCQQLCTKDVVRSILHQLDRFQADMLMIGMHPHNKVRDYFGDGIRDRLLQKANCPVMVVKPNCSQQA